MRISHGEAYYSGAHAVNLDTTLASKLGQFGHPPISWLPKDYRPVSMGGGGRTTHDDWALPFLRNISRESTAYAAPLPFRKVAGNGEPVWMPVHNPDYPFATGAQVEQRPWYDGTKDIMLPWVLTMMSVHPAGQRWGQSIWSLQEAYINGEWTTCYYTQSVNLFGSKLIVYQGLKLDEDGPMCWFPEVSGSIKWGKIT